MTSPPTTEPHDKSESNPKMQSGLKKWAAIGLPLMLVIGATLWMVQGMGKDKAELLTQNGAAQADVKTAYTSAQRPAALTWMQRGEKKLAAGDIDTATDFFNKAVAVGVDDISVSIATRFWRADGVPFDTAKVEAIAQQLSDAAKAKIWAMMGEDYLSGTPDHIDIDTKRAIDLLERAAALGNMDAEITLDNYQTGRDIPNMSESQVGSVIIDLGDIDTTPETPRTIEAYDE